MNKGFCQVCQATNITLVWVCERCRTGRCNQCHDKVKEVYNSKKCLHTFCTNEVVFDPSPKEFIIEEALVSGYEAHSMSTPKISANFLNGELRLESVLEALQSNDIDKMVSSYFDKDKVATSITSALAHYLSVNLHSSGPHYIMIHTDNYPYLFKFIGNTANTWINYLKQQKVEVKHSNVMPDNMIVFVPPLQRQMIERGMRSIKRIKRVDI